MSRGSKTDSQSTIQSSPKAINVVMQKALDAKRLWQQYSTTSLLSLRISAIDVVGAVLLAHLAECSEITVQSDLFASELRRWMQVSDIPITIRIATLSIDSDFDTDFGLFCADDLTGADIRSFRPEGIICLYSTTGCLTTEQLRIFHPSVSMALFPLSSSSPVFWNSRLFLTVLHEHASRAEALLSKFKRFLNDRALDPLLLFEQNQELRQRIRQLESERSYDIGTSRSDTADEIRRLHRELAQTRRTAALQQNSLAILVAKMQGRNS